MVRRQATHQIGMPLSAELFARYPVNIAHRRAQVLVPEQPLELMDRQSVLQLVGGVGVTQAVDTADFVDTRLTLGPAKYPLSGINGVSVIDSYSPCILPTCGHLPDPTE
jgi:hypothetical protein